MKYIKFEKKKMTKRNKEKIKLIRTQLQKDLRTPIIKISAVNYLNKLLNKNEIHNL